MASNYQKMAQQARDLFLKRDQGAMIRLWDLKHDEDFLYMTYLGMPVSIDRRTALVTGVPGEGIDETMVLFDLLTLPRHRPHAAGRWASVSTLGGIIGAGHDRTLSNEPLAARFSGRLEQLDAACRGMGGLAMGKADVSYAIPVFADFGIWFQFWEGDEEFPANIKYLFDENALEYMHYETLWYVMNSLADRLKRSVNGGEQ